MCIRDSNHTDNVEKTSKIGRPDEKPKQIILSGLSLKKIFKPVIKLISPKGRKE
mgnify:FL=1